MPKVKAQVLHPIGLVQIYFTAVAFVQVEVWQLAVIQVVLVQLLVEDLLFIKAELLTLGSKPYQFKEAKF